MMGIGLASGENRALDAAQQATNSNLLETSIAGANARAVLHRRRPATSRLTEVDEAAQIVEACGRRERQHHLRPDRATRRMGDQVRITVIATGFKASAQQQSSMDFSRKDLFASTTPETCRAVHPAAVHAAGVVLHVVEQRPLRGRGPTFPTS